jgi:twinkle protein
MEETWTGDHSEPESSFAPSAALGAKTSATVASASQPQAMALSGTATTAVGAVGLGLHPRHSAWIEARGISADLASKLGLVTVNEGGAAWLAVPYVERGRTVNHKYRLTSEKKHRMDTDAPLVLWNHDCLLEETDQPLVICEGEWDAMTALQLGWRAVSVPNGAPSSATDDPANAKRYEFLWRARDLINRQSRIILATDDDEAGKALRTDLIALLGADRCSFVEYPFPSKDLNEVLLDAGADAVHKALREAKPVPVKGLYRVRDFPAPGAVPTLSHGVPVLSEMLPIVPATLTVLTGYAGQGKTSLTVAIVANLIRYNVPVAIGTFETMPRPILERKLRAALLEVAESSLDTVSRERLKEADELIDDNLKIISQMVGEDEEMTLDDVLELARIAVVRDGCKLLILDPWNEIEHKRRRDESETEYANRSIRAIKHFMRVHNVAVWIVAHPAKPDGGNTKLGTPGLYHISGSAAWANKADYGVVYSRPDKQTNLAKVHVTKVRMGLPGREGTAELAYDWRISAFIPAPGTQPHTEIRT